jgi:hypothetical protein
MSRHRAVLVAVLVVIAGSASGGSQSSGQYPPQFPREGATKVLENERVVIWDVTYTKGQLLPIHEHLNDFVAVTLQSGTRKITQLDGKETLSQDKFGAATFTKKGAIHKEEGASDVPTRKIFIWLK